MSSHPISLVSLPHEVRTLIYHSIIGSPLYIIIYHIDTTPKINRCTSGLPTAWLRTCRLIHAEGWTLIARTAFVVWSLHSAMNASRPTPVDQLGSILSMTFLRELRCLEVMQGSLPPSRELLGMSGLQELVISHVAERQEIQEQAPSLSRLREILDEEKAMSTAINVLPMRSRPENMPFLSTRTKRFVRLKVDFWHKGPRLIGRSCQGFCMCLVSASHSWTASLFGVGAHG